MKVLVFGGSGQVGSELKRIIGLNDSVRFVDRLEADFTKPEMIERLTEDFQPTHIINAVAYTAVDQAELEESLALSVNAEAVKVIASCATRLDAMLIHYSTDYVFDGSSSRPYEENDVPNPLGVYGKSKLLGEVHIKEAGCRYMILRTSWVISATGKNFIKTILKLAKDKDQLTVVNDQIGAPTSAKLIARVTWELIQKDAQNLLSSGVYHLCSSGEASWFDVAVHAINRVINAGVLLACDPNKVAPITTLEYLARATRPLNSRLNSNKLERLLAAHMPHWTAGVDGTIDELIEKGFLK